jgi:hypothetical protein
MAKIKNVTISFTASDSPDVVGYKLYVEEVPAVVTYASPSFDMGNTTSVDLSTLDLLVSKKGVFNLGVSAVDSVGNESDMSLSNDVPLAFVAPNPPGVIVITRI